MMDQESLPGQMRPEDQAAATASAPVIKLPTVSRTNSPDNDHGNRFQSKLLFLFFMRAINNGYKFYLGTELENFAGKFDDLIFLKDYDKPNPSFLYLQAKHRQEETEAKNITTASLLDNNKGDFSLIKYFHSYVNNVMKAKGGPKPQDTVDCVICTNIDFDEDDLVNNRIKLVKLSQEELSTAPRELIAFNPIQRKPTTMNETNFIQFFPLLPAGSKGSSTTKKTNNLNYVANYLHEWAHSKPEKAPPCLPRKSFQKYFDELLKNNRIVSPFSPVETEPMTFHQDFIEDAPSLSTDAKDLRDFIVKRSKNEGVKTGNEESWQNWEFHLSPSQKIPTCYRLEPISWLEMHFVANVLRFCAGNENEPLDKQSNEFKCYQAALFNERVLIVSDETNKVITMHPYFINGTGLSTDGAKALKKIIDKLVTPSGSWTKWTFSFDCVDSFKDQLGPHKSLDDADTKNEIEDFFNNKLLFAVNTPNEEELNPILKEEVGKNKKINLIDTDLLSPYILSEMNNWFKRKENMWLTSAEKGEEILLEKIDSLRATSLSLDYQDEELKSVLSFNEAAVKEIAEKLEKLWLPRSESEEVEVTHILTPLPTFTAVKVIAALRHQIISESMKPNFDRDDSYLVTSSRRMKRRSESKWIRKSLLKEGNPQKLLIVVCDDSCTGFQVFETDDGSDSKNALFIQEEMKSLKGKRVVIIDKDETKGNSSLRDTIAYGQLSPDSIKILLSKTVSFQRNSFEMETEGENENNVTVAELIGPDEERRASALDASSIEELMSQVEQTNIEIPSYSATAFERSLYIKRGMRFLRGNFDDTFWKELADSIKKNKTIEEQKTAVDELRKQCKIDSKTGSIEWSKDIDTNLKRKIWSKIVERTRNSSPKNIPEDDLLIDENWGKRAVIISGVAGTGKSTVLSYFYEEIKKKDPSTWVIRINLTEHQTALKEFEKLSNIFEFLVQHIKVVGASPFARSLLKHRLEWGDRIVLMLDGYDEIDTECQKNTNQLVKSIMADKTTLGLYMTTRSHMVDDLQSKLGQLAYNLHNFDEEDQIKCLISIWTKKLKIEHDGQNKEQVLRDRAVELVNKVTASLNDNERSFIGVPLQCRMLAEVFPPQGLSSASDEGADEKWRNFSLAKLYYLLVQKKREIYRKEKVKAHKAESQDANLLVERAMDQLEKDLVQLAIETIVSDPEEANALLEQKRFHSKVELEEGESKRGDDGIRYGLLDVRRDGGDETTTQKKKKIVFLHRTYAEYFVADYLYKAFHLDDNQHNQLLNNEPVRLFIIEKMFVEKDEYNGVRIFFDSMLGEMIDTEGWRDINEKRTLLPERLKQFTKKVKSSTGVDALRTSVKCRREKTFLFLCDCLDATCDRPQVQTAMKKVFRYHLHEILEFFSKPNEYGDASTKVFQRFLSYFDEEEGIKKLMAQLCFIPIRYADIEKSYWDGKEQIEIVRSLLEFYEKKRLSFNHTFGQTYERLHILPLLIWNENYHHDDLLKTYLKLLSKTDKYKEDSAAFAKLIRQSFVGWIDGRIDKTLIALRDLKRLDVVNKLWPRVFISEPEACRRYYIHYQQTNNDKPVTSTVVRVNEGAADVADWLKRLLDRDEVRMSRLHRAALYNQEENVEKILDNVAQIVMPSKGEILADADDINRSLVQQVVDLMSGIKQKDDENDEKVEKDAAIEIKEKEEKKVEIEMEEEDCFTPLHVAIVCGHEEICDAMLSFLQRVGINQNQLKKQLTEGNGLLYRTLRRYMKIVGDEIMEKKLEWILKFIKVRLGQGCLLDLLKLVFTQSSGFKIRKYFPVIKDIVVSTDPVDDVDYTINYYKDLNALVFHNKKLTRKLVEPKPRSGERMIDSATLRKMLSAKGVGDWTRQYLHSVTTYEDKWEIHEKYGRGLEFILSSEFIGILTNNNELKQIIEPITEKRKIKGKTPQLSHWQHFLIDNSRYADDAKNTFFNRYFKFISTNENINWSKWFSRLVWSVDADNFKCCKDDDTIIVGLICLFNGMTYSGEGDAFQKFKNDLIRLSKERAQQMIQDVFFPSSSDDTCIRFHSLNDHLPLLFHFYLDYGSDDQLKEFVTFVTADRHWKNETRQCSFWAKWPGRCNMKEMAKLFQKLSSEKAEICGTDVVKTLLFHDVNGIPFVVKILSMEEDVQTDILSHLPEETRVVVDEHLRDMPKLINNFFLHPETYFHENTNCANRLNVLRFFLDKAGDNQRKNFIKNITKSGAENSIWVGVLDVYWYSSWSDDRESMDRFMRCVKEKLDQEAVKQLAIVRYGMDDYFVEAMIGCLDEELQQQILLQFQEELEEGEMNVSSSSSSSPKEFTLTCCCVLS